jgi:dihydroxyacetone kinase-like protein
VGTRALTTDEARRMFLHVAGQVIASKDELTQADQTTGDGDHGVAMARGFEAVREQLEARTDLALDELLKAIGGALISHAGGASGAVFGTLFRGGARHLADRSTFDAEALARFLDDGLHAVQERGKARLGDKTMVDALEPAARRAAELSAVPLDEALVAVADAACRAEETARALVARVGKAKTLGDRSRDHPDPGALSVRIILRAMAEFVVAPS